MARRFSNRCIIFSIVATFCFAFLVLRDDLNSNIGPDPQKKLSLDNISKFDQDQGNYNRDVPNSNIQSKQPTEPSHQTQNETIKDDQTKSQTNDPRLNQVPWKSKDFKNRTTFYDPILDKPNPCDGKHKVPNYIHWIWLYEVPAQFQFHYYVCALSAIKIQKPDKVFLWYDTLPLGDHWDELVEYSKKVNVPIIYKIIESPREIFNQTLMRIEHKSDVLRIMVLQQYGGIYMDFDVVFVKSLQPVMCFSVVMGRQQKTKINNGVIISEPNATFLDIWLDTYRNYKPDEYDYNDCRVPQILYEKHPNLLHVEETTMNKPNYFPRERKYLHTKGLKYDWRHNYIIHTWKRYIHTQFNAYNVKTADTALGEIFRYILFDHI